MSLVPLPDGRALISFERPRTIAEVELTIADAIADHRLSRTDQATFKAIEEILRAARRSKDVTLQQRSIIVLESRRTSPVTESPPRAARPVDGEGLPVTSRRAGGPLGSRELNLENRFENSEGHSMDRCRSARRGGGRVRRGLQPDDANASLGQCDRARARDPI